VPANIILTVMAAAGAVAAIVADHKKDRTLIYLFRPLTMTLVIAAAALGNAGPAPFKLRILLGLLACLAGDVLMMLEKKRFIEGLIAFLLGHLFYISAFLTVMRPRADLGTALPLLFFAGAMMTILFPRLGKMKVPVAAYILVITVMAGLATQRYVDIGGGPAFRAFVGAVLFVVSDSVLAVNRFVRPVAGAQAVILGSYYAAQILFALSV
jgi:uncharacterized membrane protein YhhN